MASVSMNEALHNRRLRQRFEEILQPPPKIVQRRFASKGENGGEKLGLKPALEKLRRLVVLEGLPPESGTEKALHESARCSLRGRVWKVLLCVHRASANRYIQLIERGPSIMHGKIEKDINRTLKSNEEYHMRTEDGKLRRFLNAYAHAQVIGKLVDIVQWAVTRPDSLRMCKA